MKKGHITALLSVLIVLTVSTIALAGDNICISISPGTYEGDVGETITVPVAIQSYPDGFSSSIITFGLIVNYDPAYLSVEGVSHGAIGQTSDFDSNYSLAPAIFDQQKGQVVISYSTTGTGLTQTGDFYNISFKLKAKPSSGITKITLAPRTIPDGTPFDSNYRSYSVVYTGTVIVINEQVNDSAPESNTGGSRPVPEGTASNKDPAQTTGSDADGVLAESSRDQQDNLMAINQFNDIQNHWARANIEKLVGLKILNGYSDGSFQPDKNISRAEFATVIARAMNYNLSQDIDLEFTDKDSIPTWAQPYIDAAVKAGIIKGYQDGSFRADASINRAEMAVMVMRALRINHDSSLSLSFTDKAEIPDWAAQYISEAVKQGIITGNPDNRFLPGNTATRAEAATVTTRMLEVK